MKNHNHYLKYRRNSNKKNNQIIQCSNGNSMNFRAFKFWVIKFRPKNFGQGIILG